MLGKYSVIGERGVESKGGRYCERLWMLHQKAGGRLLDGNGIMRLPFIWSTWYFRTCEESFHFRFGTAVDSWD